MTAKSELAETVGQAKEVVIGLVAAECKRLGGELYSRQMIAALSVMTDIFNELGLEIERLETRIEVLEGYNLS